MKYRILVLLLIPMLILAACRQTTEPTAEGLTIEAVVSPEPLMMGEATMTVTLTDSEGNPVDGATVNLNANMSHAGMVPVLAETSDSEDGVYEIPFEWTMGGDWVVTIDVTLSNGETASQEFEFAGVGGDMDMEATEEAHDMDMDMEATEEAEMSDMDMEATEEAEMSDMDMEATEEACDTDSEDSEDVEECEIIVTETTEESEDMDMEATEEAHDMDMDAEATEEAHDMDVDMEATEEAEMSDMGMGGMHGGVFGVSGSFMLVTNDTEEDVTLVSASAEIAGAVEIHETIIENDVARMVHMEDGLVIPAGESLELRPGSYHVMLMQLSEDLVEGETVSITLEFDNETTITLDVPVVSMPMAEEMSVEVDGITVSGAWARATALADSEMSDMDMEATEEAEMSDMDMEATEEAHDMSMGEMHGGVFGVSGSFMLLTNDTEEDVTLVSASAEIAGAVEIHETIIENDVARMVHMEDGLVIPAGESLELRPGSYHVMLMQLSEDLVEGETVSITLEFDNETTIELDVPIVSMPMVGEPMAEEMSVEVDGITVSGAWARATALADSEMSDMDMEATEEAHDMDMDMEATEEATEEAGD